MSEMLEQKIERLKRNVDAAEHKERVYVEVANAARANLAAAQAELDKQKSAAWRPEIGQQVWWVAVTGTNVNRRWDGDEFDRSAYSQGNLFPTREAADRERDRRILIADMRRWAQQHGFRLQFDVISFNVIGVADAGASDVIARDVSEFAKRLHLLND